MNLRHLRELDTHESRSELLNALDKLKKNFILKHKKYTDVDTTSPRKGIEHYENYLMKLGCEIKYGPIKYKESPEFINISYSPFSIKWPNQWHIKVPVEIAERILVLGMP
jgi:hypothetical protein